MWVRNAWYVAAWARELAPGQLLARIIIDEPLVLYRTGDGAVAVLEDRCCHRFAPLSKGRIEGDDLRCAYHGLKFAADGRCIEIPGQTTIPPAAFVRNYRAVEQGARIWVWMGDAASADAGLIPAPSCLEHPGYRSKLGELEFAADYQLMNDNLLDLSHLSFVHAKTLGSGAPQWAEERPRIARLERGLRVQRWIRNKVASNYMRRFGDTLDSWHAYDFLVPGIFLLASAWFAAGTADRAANGPPTEPPLFLRLDEQAVTPTTSHRSRYFYAVAARTEDVDDRLLEKLYSVTTAAFHEDKEIIEAQQTVIDRDPGRSMLATSFDSGPTQFRRVLRELAEREGH